LRIVLSCLMFVTAGNSYTQAVQAASAALAWAALLGGRRMNRVTPTKFTQGFVFCIELENGMVWSWRQLALPRGGPQGC